MCPSEAGLRGPLYRGAEVGSEALDEFRINRGLADVFEVAGDVPQEFEGIFLARTMPNEMETGRDGGDGDCEHIAGHGEADSRGS